MKKILHITKEITNEILEFLYKDEVMNVLTIHYFENRINEIGELYLSRIGHKLNALLHIKDDGNSHFTTFYAEDTLALETIAKQIGQIEYKDLLIAGVDSEVRFIMSYLDRKAELYLNVYYMYAGTGVINNDNKYIYKLAENHELPIVREFMISFFEADTTEAKEKIADKIDLSKIRLLYLNEEPIGYGSFFGHSKNYIDVSSVYIDAKYRGKGHSKVLMNYLISEALEKDKTPILQASNDKEAANKTYTNVGFKNISGYAFQFINKA
jgi:predicted GNAT family acetyltransferase